MSFVEPSVLEFHAAVVLAVGFGLSLLYELWRTFGVDSGSHHDSIRSFVRQLIPLYSMATAVIVLLLVGAPGAAWIGLVFSITFIVVSIAYYNSKVLLERLEGAPNLLDWSEDFVYTGLLFVAVALLAYEVGGRSLQ